MTAELGPMLGRMMAPAGDRLPAGLEETRIALLTELFERREAATRGGGSLTADAWLAAWESAARKAAVVVAGEVERRLREAAVVARFPAARLQAMLPDGDARRVLEARYQAAGIPLEEVSGAGDFPERRAAAALEAAWDRLGSMVGEDLAAWERRAAAVRAWRRPWRPLALWGSLAMVAAAWLGLVLGGYLPVPGPLRPLADWYWSLSWP